MLEFVILHILNGFYDILGENHFSGTIPKLYELQLGTKVNEKIINRVWFQYNVLVQEFEHAYWVLMYVE